MFGAAAVPFIGSFFDRLPPYPLIGIMDTQESSETHLSLDICSSFPDSSSSSSGSSTETEESVRRNIPDTPSLCKNTSIPLVISASMSERVTRSTTSSCQKRNAFIDDGDSIGQEMAKMMDKLERSNASKPDPRRVTIGEDLVGSFADETSPGKCAGTPVVAEKISSEELDGKPTARVRNPYVLPHKAGKTGSATKRFSGQFGDRLAIGLKHGTIKKNIGSAVQLAWDKCDENSKQYEKIKANNFERMMEIIRDNGGPELKVLASETVWDGFEEVPLLIDVLRNVKDRRYFLVILDECLKFFVEFAKKNDGKIYSCGSMHQKLKHIFAILNGKYNIMVKEKDFGTSGTFRARISNIWTDERKKNPEFGQAKGNSEICLHYVKYIMDALWDGVLLPRKNPFHLRLLMQFILIRFFALRGIEAAALDLRNIRWKIYNFGPDFSKHYVELNIDITKVQKLKLGSWKIPKNYGKYKLRDNPDMRLYI